MNPLSTTQKGHDTATNEVRPMRRLYLSREQIETMDVETLRGLLLELVKTNHHGILAEGATDLGHWKEKRDG